MKRHASPFRTLRRLRSPLALLLLLAVAGALLFSPAPAVQAQTPSTDATLSALKLNLADTDATAVAISPAFASATDSYTAEVANDVAETAVTPTVNHDGASYVVRLDGVADADGIVDLAVGENVVGVEVTAEDGATVKTYTVTVTRAEPPSAPRPLIGHLRRRDAPVGGGLV